LIRAIMFSKYNELGMTTPCNYDVDISENDVSGKGFSYLVKNIKRMVVNQLQRQFPNWNWLPGKKKKQTCPFGSPPSIKIITY